MAKTSTDPATLKKQGLGILGIHRKRIENDPQYRDAALTAPLGIRGKYLTNTAPNAMIADRDKDAKKAERTQAQRDGHSILDDTLTENA